MNDTYSPAGFSRASLIGFLLPITAAILLTILLSHPTPKAIPSTTPAKAASTAQAASPTGSLPSSDEVSAANAAILAYCTSDLRQGTSCSLMADSNVTAPGFVESGLHMTGSFQDDGGSTQGLALAKGSGSSWQVIWVGQGCVPKDVATQNNVPSSYGICSS